MPADAVNYGKLAIELNETLSGGRIDKIIMRDKSTLMLLIRAGGQNRNLVITAAASPRCYLTSSRLTSTDVPLAFCLHLRRHIGGGVVDNVEAVPFERILAFHITSRGDLGETLKRIMFVEIMGKYSNVVLTDGERKITDALKHISFEEGRPILPGVKYAPPDDSTRFYPTDADAAATLRASSSPDNLAEVMIKRLRGLSAATANEIIELSDGDNLAVGVERLVSKPISPVCYFDGEKPTDFSFCEYKTIGGEKKSYPSLSEAMDEYYSYGALVGEKSTAENFVRRAIGGALDKQRKKLVVFERERSGALDFDHERIIGELLTSNLYKIKHGDKSVVVDNWYEGGQTEIKLTENTPQEDAQKHFKRYQKKKRTLTNLEGQIADAKAAIDYLESVEAALSVCNGTDEIEDIADELEEAGYIGRQNKKKKTSVSEPRKYTVDGFDVLVGKSNLQNDKITKEARGEDIWLHTQGFHGSHVIVKARGKEVPSSVIAKSAEIAAFFSKARQSENVPVDYTKAKNVYKKKGAAPGKVDYFSAKTLFVTPAPPSEK